jgi:hypothetical protein
MQASDDAKCFFYFTKESHIYTLLNSILEGGIETKIKRSTIPELDYLSQICFELYESENNDPPPPKEENSGEDGGNGGGNNKYQSFKYSIRITISPGCHVYDPLDVQLDSKHCISCAQRRSLTPHCDWKEVIETLRAKFHTVKLPKSFVAVNLSDAFSWPEKQQFDDDQDEVPDAGDILEMRAPGRPKAVGAAAPAVEEPLVTAAAVAAAEEEEDSTEQEGAASESKETDAS